MEIYTFDEEQWENFKKVLADDEDAEHPKLEELSKLTPPWELTEPTE